MAANLHLLTFTTMLHSHAKPRYDNPVVNALFDEFKEQNRKMPQLN